MILNHKAAIEFLVEGADSLELDPPTVRNLHALLADGLMPDADAPGRLRRMVVEIGGSVFHPLAVPQAIESGFERLLATARAIDEPHERSLFVLAQLPYLQPFDDVNERTARLAANLPLIRANLVPLSFVDVSESLYVESMLAYHELGDVRPLRALFVFACERSAQRYAAVRQSLGEPDPFRLRHRLALGEIVGDIVREGLGRRAAWERLRAFADARLERRDREPFVEMAESELLGLHVGNYARYRVRASEFASWSDAWGEGR